MANYATFANGATGGSDKGILCVGSDGTTRMGLYDVIIGNDATPGDQAAEYVVNRNTDTGTGGTAVTPEPLDPTQPAAKSTSTHGAYATTEPADTANSELLHIALNQRA